MTLALDSRILPDAVSPRAATRLRAFRRSVEKAMGGRVARVVLFGSRARGDANVDSDFDVAVFVADLTDRKATENLLSDLAYPHVMAGIHIRPVALPDTFLHAPGNSSLARHIAIDGVSIA